MNVVMLILMLASVNFVTAQTTAFRYQGRLVQAGVPANGQYDFMMTLWDQSAAGTQVGPTINLSGVTVSDGSFTALLDFGANAFNGSDRYLEISVRVSGDPQLAFQPLSPRQQFTSTPYAIKSITAGTADALTPACVSCVSSSQIGSISTDQISAGTLSTNRGGTGLNAPGPSGNVLKSNGTTWTSGSLQTVDVPDLSGSYVKNGSAQQPSANFNIAGNGTAAGTLSASKVNATTQYNLNNLRVLSTAGTANIFVGANTGTANAGSNNSFLGNNAGSANTTGSLNSFFGSDSGLSNTSGGNNSFYGYHAGHTNGTGNNNSFFGSNSGRSNFSGFNNAFFGKDAGFDGNSTHDNAFFGYTAGYSNASNLNSFFGSGSGSANIAGASNSFFGYTAGSHNIGGNGNSFFGSAAGLSNDSGSNNTYVGLNAGLANTSGSNNVLIGANTNITDGLTNATAIGYRAQATTSNTLILGSIDGVNGATSNTKVGIGTTFPTDRLTILTASNSYGWVHSNGNVTVGSWVGGTGAQPYGGWIGTKTPHPLSFFVSGGGAAVTIETSGFLRLNNVDAGGSLQLCLGPSNHISFCSSSLRYKTDVKRFTGGLNVVSRLQPITFSWKEGGVRDVGFGAEEVEKVEPLLTFRNPKGQVEGVKYNQITAVLVNAVKEQQDQISAQQEQLNNLSKLQVENRQLRAQLDNISGRLERMEQRRHRHR